MTDRLWGANPTDEDLPFAEGFGYLGPGLVVGNGGSGTTSGGSFTMPWAGNLTAAYTGVCTWQQNGHQQAALHLGSSSPAPTSYSYMSSISMNFFGYNRVQIPMYAAWSGLAKGQVVSFVVYMYVGGGGWSVTLEALAATIRAWPAGLESVITP